MFIRIARTASLALTAALALSSAITSCNTSDTADTGSTWGQTAYPRAASVTVPADIADNAAKRANKAADTCTDVTGDLIMTTIAVRSGYVLSDRTATGGYGYASMPTAQWDRFAVAYDETTGAEVSDRKSRQDNLADAPSPIHRSASLYCRSTTQGPSRTHEGPTERRRDKSGSVTMTGQADPHGSSPVPH